MRGTYDAMMAPYIVCIPTIFKKIPLKMKEIVANFLTCVQVLVNCFRTAKGL